MEKLVGGRGGEIPTSTINTDVSQRDEAKKHSQDSPLDHNLIQLSHLQRERRYSTEKKERSGGKLAQGGRVRVYCRDGSALPNSAPAVDA